MQNMIVIGSRPEKEACGARTVHGYNRISENSQAYWIRSVIGDIDLRVYAGCPEHDELRALLQEKFRQRTLDEFTTGLVLQHITPREFRAAYEHDLEKARIEGADAKALEIRNALGI